MSYGKYTLNNQTMNRTLWLSVVNSTHCLHPPYYSKDDVTREGYAGVGVRRNASELLIG